MRYDLGTIVLAALIATANGACDTNTLFFGDVNLSTVPPYQLTVVSAVGTYVLEPNNVSLVAYRHIGRPDQFLLQEPSAAAQKNWVVATLPDNKKPAEVQHAYEAWPEAGNILARGEFEGEPWAPGAGAWEVNDCDEGRTPLPSLSLSCVAPTFGQCATERWRVVEPESTFVDVLTPAEKEVQSHGRREFQSPSQRVYVGDDGRWRLASKSPAKVKLVSTTTAERLEHVRGWRAVSDAGAESETETKIECEPLRSGETDPCAANPCKNNGTCIAVPDSPGAYHCRCQFDSVSPNCEAVRECRVPKRVANAQLLFTSDLSPQGKAFYRCDVGYYVKNGTGSAGNRTTNSAFATCDGRSWNNVPTCEPITTTVTIEAAYVHHCNFDAGWCDRYQYGATLTPTGRTLSWERTTSQEEGRRHYASVRHSGSSAERQLGILQTPCMFVPTEGCVAVDVLLDKNATLTIVDDDEVTLWRTASETQWTTATLTLPPGSNRLSFEAVLGRTGARVAVDNIRVFQWNCGQVTKLLFPPPPSSRSSASAMLEAVTPLLSLLALLAYSKMAGVLAA
ncbi:uncharacterized protein LOC122394489 [Amphibalanus amphitrite]|uniref:uncharacterized protein LOC122394489 n=1 Tax=Amphibalanus amphitrite TaxID=1232801 RepID=UPI001C91158B|nr:uncharacterized protein LOC122394489 [Amphibalanus amphitrite]